ncbi:MAG: hypothetical protein DELT_01552 [Desulfovibrio sp.]
MLSKFSRAITPVTIAALLLTLPTLTASAASFALPSDAHISVVEFTFPESTANLGGQDLPAGLRDKLVEALQKHGFTASQMQPGVTAAPITESGEQKEGEAANDSENSGENTDESTGESTGEKPGESIGEKTGASPEGAETDKDLASVFATETPEVQAKAEPAQYTLSGHVTLLRENIGAPTRIGGGIRIRLETLLHCTYRVADASGNVLISGTASDSSARLTSNAQNVDDVLADLTDKVIIASAGKIAAQLAGVDFKSTHGTGDKEYYQDSPGKRLRKD